MRQISRCGNATEFQKLPVRERDTALRKLLDAGVSIRQASRITGVSFGIVRKFTE
jgi:transposase